jgi:hypothetical protein
MIYQPVAGDDDKEMLQIVDDHHHELNIDDSKDMMVGIAYGGMPFELEQFGLFHVSMHIEDTTDTSSNKEVHPLVPSPQMIPMTVPFSQVTSKTKRIW